MPDTLNTKESPKSGARDLLEQLPGAIFVPKEYGKFRDEDPSDIAGYVARKPFDVLAKWFQDCIAEEREYGHLYLWAPVMVGTGATLWFSAQTDLAMSSMVAGLVVMSLVWAFLGSERGAARIVAASMALLFAGAACAAWEARRAATIILDSPVTSTVSGTIVARESEGSGRWRYTLDLFSTQDPTITRMPQRIALVARSSQQEYEVGTAISGRARLSPPSGPALTGLNDFAFESYFSGIGAIGYFYSVKAATNPSSAPPDVMAGLMLDLERLRGSISHAFEVVLPGDTGAFAASMFTNDQRAMTKETSEALRLAGLAHIIAISGLNMALAAGLFLVGFRMLFAISQRLTHAWPVKKFAALGALISLTAYYMISGFAVSAERAYVMMAIMLVAVILGRPSISLRNVATSALLILVYTPSAVMGPGFQMSYAATLALVTGYSALQRRDWGRVSASGVAILRPLLPVWKFASGIFMTSLIGGLSTALFSMEHFHRLAAWGLPANLLAMPIISFIVMPFGIIGLLCMPFHLEWLPLKIMGYGLDLVIEIAKWAASLGGEIDTGRMPGWMFAGCAFGLLALAILRSRLRYLGAALALLAFLPFFAIPQISGQRLVIFEDGKLAGIVSNRTIATNTARPPAFVMEQWQRALVSKTISVPNVLPPINIDMSARKLASEDISAARDAMRLDLVPPTDPGFTCRPKQWCFTRLGAGLRVIIVDSGGLVGPACDIADIVITSARLRWSSCRSGAMLVSAETLRRTGSLEILVPQNAIHATDLSVTAALVNPTRPWSIHRLYDWRQRKFVLDGA